ncbi:hypothetical protein [Algoriphagus sp. A40]|uniref:hypothetical protein n=1 Tax=Algoriphagus sp. A40 TaxID=1945863 RepID=UPI000985DFC5|nr:hypothetical protein [Algoriphagus sp. A40]OOG77260.1 hypothetical protein B0E43_06640 [Algoriphagus sp. A40]
MMNETQLTLDLELWLNADIYRRQNVLKRQFISLLEEIGNSFSANDLSQISKNSKGSKISKGNDLLGFPYQVLDLIRDFDPDSGVNIRLLNWFGNGFFLTVLLGKNRLNPIKSLLDLGFNYGLSENQWDYPDLILKQNHTLNQERIKASALQFHHWIKVYEPKSEPKVNSEKLCKAIKKILGILRLPSEQSGI